MAAGSTWLVCQQHHARVEKLSISVNSICPLLQLNKSACRWDVHSSPEALAVELYSHDKEKVDSTGQRRENMRR